MAEIERRRADLLSGRSKTYSWEGAKNDRQEIMSYQLIIEERAIQEAQDTFDYY